MVFRNNSSFYNPAVTDKTKDRYISDCDQDCIKQVCDEFHLPGHVGRNAMRKYIGAQYMGISVKTISRYVESCTHCQRESVPTPVLPLKPIIPNFIRERLIVDTIDCQSTRKPIME